MAEIIYNTHSTDGINRAEVTNEEELVVTVSPSSGKELDTSNISFADTMNFDAFQRFRVSELTTLMDLKQIQGEQVLFIDEELNGTATSTYSAAGSMTTLATVNAGDWIVHQTKQRFNYQSGKSHLVFMTLDNFESVAGVHKEIGYLNSDATSPYNTGKDGIAFCTDGTDYMLRIYKSGTIRESLSRSGGDWLDKLDGTGPSGLTVDFTKSNIIAVDFQWLGVGRVRVAMDIDGILVPFAVINNANKKDGVYMTSPNHSLRWELRQTGATPASFDYICGSVNTEGAINTLGKVLSEDNGTTNISVSNTGRKYVMFSGRLKQTNLDAIIDILDVSFLSISNDNLLYNVYINPTGMVGTLTHTDVVNSSIQIAKGDSSQYFVGEPTTYTKIDSGYIKSNQTFDSTVENALRIGAKIDGTADEIVVTVQPLTTNANVLPTIKWRETI